MSLKQKTIAGFTWSFIEVLSKQGLVFIIGIILARLLTPREFGLIGMTTIFISFSQVFIDSGFGQALVRKQNCTQADFSTVFYFNLLAGILLFILLFILADPISLFFNEPKLVLIIQVISVGLVIKSLSLIQSVLLIKKIDFKTTTKVSVISSLSSGAIGIYMAYIGFGVWSLVAKFLLNYTFTTIFLWIYSSWKPSFIFRINSFKELFSFGSKLLASNLINRVYENIYLLLIGKYFSASDLGYYTRANMFKDLFSKNLSVVIIRVAYPSLATVQEDNIQLKKHYRKLIKSSMLIVFTVSFGVIAMAKPMILTLIGEKWLPSVIYLQLLSIVGFLYPLQEINKNILKVKGRSDILLKIEAIIKIGTIPLLILGVYLGILQLILILIIIATLACFVNIYYAGNTISYSVLTQLKDISSSFFISVIAATVAYIPLIMFDFAPIVFFSIQIATYLLSLLLLHELFRREEYLLIKNIFTEKIKKRNN